MKPVYTIMFFVSISLVVASVVALGAWGLNLGVDFKGGSVAEIEFTAGRPDTGAVRTMVAALPGFSETNISEAGTDRLVVRTGQLTEAQHQQLLGAFTKAYAANGPRETRFDSIGPAIGAELKSKSLTAVFMVLIAIILYIALVFRAMRRVLSPWVMSFAAIVALLHDVLIPLGVFAALGHFVNVQISAVFVAAILTILGYSVSDTVVIFDRVRENILRGVKERFAVVVHMSVMQTLVRSLNTTLTTLISLIAIYLFGGESIRYFALALILGIGLGAYSSIFVAAPLLVWMGRDARR
ncbi:MAG: protein translocase subunit SecF [Candidatus Yanofskybacteria bacterium]|nr:protein translocase subunit SecF [Candidatus Yanofskybacteria bacterium]